MAPVKNRVEGGARMFLYQRRGSLCNVGCKGEPFLFLTRAGFVFSTEYKYIKYIYIYSLLSAKIEFIPDLRNIPAVPDLRIRRST